MKTVKVIVKVEFANALKPCIEELEKFFSIKKGYNYSLVIVSKLNTTEEITKNVPSFVSFVKAEENEKIENAVNRAIVSSESDYTIVTRLDDENWNTKLNRIINNLDEGIDVCKISKLFSPTNFLYGLLNFFLRIYFACINLFVGLKEKNLDCTDMDYQGFSKKAVYIMKNMPDRLFVFRSSDSFVMLKKKNLYLKKNNSGVKIEHIEKKGINLTQTFSFIAIFVALVIIVLINIFLVDKYIVYNEMFKFVCLNLWIVFITITYSFCNFFYEEAQKIKF